MATAALVIQALVSLLVWLVVDDRPSGSFGNSDLREWVLISLASAGLLTALGGAASRRWWVAAAVAAGCVLAVALGLAGFAGYAVLHSA